MTEWETASGLVVTDRRHHRVYDRDDVPNPNPPIGTVGPQSAAGEVMSFTPPPVLPTSGLVPPGAQAWAGWPNGWTVPWSTGAGWARIAGCVSTLWAVLDLNSSVIATMPAYTTTGDEPNEPEYPWVTNPQPEVYSGGWPEFLTQVLVAWWLGEAFVWATSRYASGYPRTFVMLNPAWVNIEWDGGRKRYTLGGVDISDDVLHLPYVSWPGDLHGHGPLEAAYGPLLTAQAVEQFTRGLAQSGGHPWAVLQHPATLTANQSEELRTRYVEARLGALTNGQAAAPLILSGGLTLTPLTVSVKELALIDVMQLARADVATLFSCPPHLVNLPTGQDSLTYNNAAQYRMNHWQIYLRPKAAKVMAYLSGWLLPRGQKVELDRDDYVAPEPKERAETDAMLFAIQDPVTGERASDVAEIRERWRFGPGRRHAIPAPVAVTQGAPDE